MLSLLRQVGSYAKIIRGAHFSYSEVSELTSAQFHFVVLHIMNFSPHKYATMWTIRRTPNVPAGCNFYLSKYGVRIQQASNSLIAWQPEDEHGSSLPCFHPADMDPGFCQQGVAFVTSNRLGSAWRKVQDGTYTREHAAKYCGKR